MDKEVLIRANIDYEKGKNRFAGKEALYYKYLLKFKEDKHFDDAKEAFLAKDYEKLLEETHALKGVAGTLGLLDIYHDSAEIVNAIRKNETEKVAALFDSLCNSYARTIEILK